MTPSSRSDRYKVDVHCGNCNWRGRVSIPMGMPINRKDCPTCGCARLSVIFRPIMWMARGFR